MICFRDMTFCSKECGNTKCGRNLTEQVRKDADKWWGKGKDEAPIAVANFHEGCEDYKEVVDDKQE